MGREDLPRPKVAVERTWVWLSKCRAILVRDNRASNYLGLLQLVCANLWCRHQRRLLF